MCGNSLKDSITIASPFDGGVAGYLAALLYVKPSPREMRSSDAASRLGSSWGLHLHSRFQTAIKSSKSSPAMLVVKVVAGSGGQLESANIHTPVVPPGSKATIRIVV